MTELVALLHRAFTINKDILSIPLHKIRASISGTAGQLLLTTHYEELCRAVPTWIKCRVVKKETIIDLKKPAFTVLDV